MVLDVSSLTFRLDPCRLPLVRALILHLYHLSWLTERLGLTTLANAADRLLYSPTVIATCTRRLANEARSRHTMAIVSCGELTENSPAQRTCSNEMTALFWLYIPRGSVTRIPFARKATVPDIYTLL